MNGPETAAWPSGDPGFGMLQSGPASLNSIPDLPASPVLAPPVRMFHVNRDGRDFVVGDVRDLSRPGHLKVCSFQLTLTSASRRAGAWRGLYAGSRVPSTRRHRDSAVVASLGVVASTAQGGSYCECDGDAKDDCVPWKGTVSQRVRIPPGNGRHADIGIAVGVDWPDCSIRLARKSPMQDRHSGLTAVGQAPEPDPVVDAYKRHIDRTLLRQNLRRTVTERVENLMALQRLAAEARRAGRSLRGDN